MGKLVFKTPRLKICKFDISMAKVVSELSLDEDNRKFLPDEVFETEEDAKEIITELIDLYDDGGTYVYPILLNDKNIGHVELIELKDFFEVGYHIGEKYQNHGYATEALLGFLNYIKTNFNLDKVYGTSLKENVKSIKVMEKSGFKLEFEGKGKYQGKIEEIVRYSKSL